MPERAIPMVRRRLGDISADKKFAIVDGPFGTQLHADEYVDEGVPVVRVTNTSYEGRFLDDPLVFITEKKAKQLQRSEVFPGDIIVAKTGATIGKLAEFPDHHRNGIIASSCIKISVDPDQAAPRLVKYLLASPEGQRKIIEAAGGSTRTTINCGPFGDIEFDFPESVKTQQQLVEILSTVDEAIEQTEALIAKREKVKTGLMHDIFTRGVRPDGQLRPPREEAPQLYHESPLGWIPKDWNCDLLDKLADRGSGHTPNRNIPSYWNGGVKWVSLADSYRLDQLYIDDTEHEISQAGIQNSSAVLHPPGIVVLSRDAGVGKSAITTKPMAVSQHFMCWRCDERLDKYYLYYWLQYKKRMFENIAVGTTIQTIGLPYFRKLKISLPVEPDEQKRIGEILRASDHEIFDLRSELEKTQQIKAGLMNDLLNGRVEVGVIPGSGA